MDSQTKCKHCGQCHEDFLFPRWFNGKPICFPEDLASDQKYWYPETSYEKFTAVSGNCCE